MTGLERLPETFQISIFRIGKAAVHSHLHAIEILLPLRGKATVFTNLKEWSLDTGDILIIDSGTIHSIQSDNAYICSIYINLEAYRDEFQYLRCASFERIIRKTTEDTLEMYIRNILLRLIILYSMKTTSATDAAGNLISLLLGILPYSMVEFLNPEYTCQGEDALQRVVQISTYLSDHYAEKITATKLAKREGISMTRLSHFWKDASTLSITDTLTVIRLGYSIADVVFSSKRIEDIAMSHGFNNVKYFYRCFSERYGMTPREYQKEILNLHENENILTSVSYRQLKNSTTAYAISHYHPEVDPTSFSIPSTALVSEETIHHLYSTLLSKNNLLVEQGRKYNQKAGYLILSPSRTILAGNKLNWEYIYASVNFYQWGEFDVVIQVDYDSLDVEVWDGLLTNLLQEMIFLWDKLILRHIRFKIQTTNIDMYDSAGKLGQRIHSSYPEVRVDTILLI